MCVCVRERQTDTIILGEEPVVVNVILLGFLNFSCNSEMLQQKSATCSLKEIGPCVERSSPLPHKALAHFVSISYVILDKASCLSCSCSCIYKMKKLAGEQLSPCALWHSRRHRQRWWPGGKRGTTWGPPPPNQSSSISHRTCRRCYSSNWL